MIEIRNLYKRYHNHHGSDWVLRDINLTIPKGVSVGVVGRNGAGKSTLLRLIGDMDTPERGEIRRYCKVSWPMGLAGGFQGSMTGRQNVKFVARIHGSGAQIQRIIDFVEDFAEIGPAFDEPIRTYSSGMRSRLAFGLSLAFDFDVYLSDEATATGDRAFRAKATKAFRDKVGQASLIMVSHSEGILKDLCQAGVYLKKGRATWYDDINEAIAAYHEDTGGPAKNEAAKPKPSGSTAPKAQTQPAPARAKAQSDPIKAADAARKQARRALDQAKKELEALEAAGEPDPQALQQASQRVKRRKARLDKARRELKSLQAADAPDRAAATTETP